MCTSLEERYGALVLLDFKAAFPSMEHDFLFEALAAIGLPPEAIQVVRSLYSDGGCDLVMGRDKLASMSVTAGIRQGCPLSPLLFAAGMDLLLRTFEVAIPGRAPHRAFADDTGLLLTDVHAQLPVLATHMGQFAAISGMDLNIRKTVAIPLWQTDLEEARKLLLSLVPSWEGLQVAKWGLYLGCAIGPGSPEHAWDVPLKRVRQRTPSWPWAELGLHFAIMAYNTYISSSFSFVGQFAHPSAEVLKLEEWAIGKAAPGPFGIQETGWATKEDMFNLKATAAMPIAFRSLAVVARAAQSRLYAWENKAQGGLGIDSKYKRLQALLRSSDYLGRTVEWRRWYAENAVSTLHDTQLFLKGKGMDSGIIARELARGEPHPWTRITMRRVQKNFQREITSRLSAATLPHPVARLTEKMGRWTPSPKNSIQLSILVGVPRTLADRRLARLAEVSPLLPPRVLAAGHRLQWNGWPTHRRQARRLALSNKCTLGCSPTAEDSVEHYCRCPLVRAYHRDCLRLDKDCLLQSWLLCEKDKTQSIPQRARALIGVYAVYRATNSGRYERAFTPQTAPRALKQAGIEGTIGHRRAERLLEFTLD